MSFTITNILDELHDIRQNRLEGYLCGSALEFIYDFEVREPSFALELDGLLADIGLSHKCERALALYDAGDEYASRFVLLTVEILKSLGMYDQDHHNCLAMWDACHSHS
jgi:hypothetical protein